MSIAERVRAQIEAIDREAFVKSRDEIDMVAYRLGSIGEYVNKLSPELKERHPEIGWRRVYDMRNALFHDYDGAMPAVLWRVAGEPLMELVVVCRAELDSKTR